MKIAFGSDLHLGYANGRRVNKQGINLRQADGFIAFQQEVNDIIAHNVDCFIIGGDIFHSPKPDVNAILFAQSQFRKLSKAGIPVYMIAGNHDVTDIKSDIAASRLLHDPDRKIYSHTEPYVKYNIGDNVFLHLVSHHMYSEQEATMNSVTPVKDSINIFTTHGSVIDPVLKLKLHTENSPREIIVPEFMLDDKDWSYALFGHIHERGWVGSTDGETDTNNQKIFYNGSLIRRGYADKPSTLGRGWTLWTISDTGVFSSEIKTVPQRPQYDFEPIDASNHNAKEITDVIINNLKGTQVDGNTYNSLTAPILRQKIVNLESSKQSGIDWKAIEYESQHAFNTFSEIIKTSTNLSLVNNNKKQGVETNLSGDLIEAYDTWVDSSPTLKNKNKDFKEKVRSEARDFITNGQEVVLNEE